MTAQSNELRSAALRRIAVFGFWICVWQLCSMFIGYGIFVASPWQTMQRLCQLCARADFWRAVLNTTGRIFTGYLPAVILGILLAALVKKVRWAAELLLPLVRMIRTVPVASFIILALILVSSRYLTQLIAFLMAMPVICLQMETALRQLDARLEEMARMFRVPLLRRIRYLYLPQLLPTLGTSMILALSFAWKSGIAAEVIGMPSGSIGERLQQAKVYLATPDLFAWTVVILILSFVTEKLLRLVLKLADRFSKAGLQADKKGTSTAPGQMDDTSHCGVKGDEDCKNRTAGSWTEENQIGRISVRVSHLEKSYGEQRVIRDMTQEFDAGGRYALSGASGTGKTTLLRLLAGLEKPDAGTITAKEAARGTETAASAGAAATRVCMLFQEDRLLDHLSAVENVHFITPRRSRAQILQGLDTLGIDPADADRPVREWSGGMKRRAALLRTLLSDGDMLLLDEPFQGLDEDNKERALSYIKACQNGRILVVSTHGGTEAEKLGAEEIRI